MVVGLSAARLRPAGKRSVVISSIVGFALFLNLVTFVLWSGPSIVLSPMFVSPSIPATVRSLSFYSAFFAVALSSNLTIKKYSTLISAVLSLLLFLGVVLSALPDAQDPYSPFFSILGALLIGAGCAFSFSFWVINAAKLGLRTAGIIIMSATILSGPLYFACMLFEKMILIVVIGIVLPLASLLLVFCTHKTAPADDQGDPHPKGKESFSETFLPHWRSILSICAIAFVSGALRMASLPNDSAGSTINDVSTLAMSFSAIVFIIVWIRYQDRFGLTSIYQIAFPVIATGFLAVPFLGHTYQYFFAGLSYSAFSVVSMLMMITCIQAASQSSQKLRLVYGFFAGCSYLAVGIGVHTGFLATSADGFGFTQLLILTLVCVYLLGITFFAVRARQQAGRSSTVKTEVIILDNDNTLITRQCSELAREYLLSKREHEIAELLARGRDVPYISNALFISKNTVRTHSKNLYRKLDIHSRQELLDKLEEVLPSS